MAPESKNLPRFRVPIALHIYSSLILITLLTVFVIGVYSNMIIQSLIAKECDDRIKSAVNSCQTFAEAFRTSIDPESGNAEDIKKTLLNAIVSSTDLSNDASIILFTGDGYVESKSGSNTILWPTASYSVSAATRSQDVLSQICEADGINTDGTTRVCAVNNDMIYYRFVSVEYYESEEETENHSYEPYYLLIYVNSSAYYSFSSAMNVALIRSILLSILASAIISFIVAFPLYFTTRKLARFAGRVGKGDFTPLSGHLVSRELSDLGDVMNRMAEKLEDTDREQKTFFQNASHELRTPLMSIQGYAEGIKYGVFDEDKSGEAVDVIIDETTRLSSLVENLLSISKMDMSKSGNYEVKKEPLNAGELSELLIDKVRGGFLHDGKSLKNDIKAGNSYIMGNESDLIRMLENVFSNCLRYASKEVVFICREESGKVIFDISDDGPGISEDVMNKLFSRFATGNEGKHGIGLALVKSIAEEHNGQVTAENKPEGGARFVIKIPVIR
ncbi:MAG: HAMP domain-containing histidine kinase, partial [Clostridiales bacterium]|nr:HAMP domain-containing histidine kinase [Clostridiales bacterium]